MSFPEKDFHSALSLQRIDFHFPLFTFPLVNRLRGKGLRDDTGIFIARRGCELLK
jgi:hypothetical protein